MTSLADLKKAGGFVPDAPVEKTITFKTPEGEEVSAKIHVRKLGVAAYEELFGPEGISKSRTANAIHIGIRLGNGKEVIPYDLAESMDTSLATAMMAAFNEVNARKKS